MKSTPFGVYISNSHLSPKNCLNRHSTDWITRVSVAPSDFFTGSKSIHQSVQPYLPLSPPPKKNNQKNHQGAIMTTRQTIAPPTPPNVKINSPISQKNLSHFRTHFPKNLSHLVQNPPRPQIRDNCDNCDNRDNKPTVGADLSRTPPIYRPARHHHHHRSAVGADLSCTRFIVHPVHRAQRRFIGPPLTLAPPTLSYTHQPPKPCTPPPQYATNIARKSVTPKKPR